MTESTALITGASRGLGLALAKLLLEKGYTVAGITRSKKYWASALKAVKRPQKLHFYAADLTSETEVKKTVTAVINKFKKIDVIVNNAGIGGGLSRVEDLKSAGYDALMDGNLKTAFLVCKYMVPYLRKTNRGWLINISSMAGQRAVPRLFAYSAAKFGVLALSQCIAKENSDKRFKCITVCPGGMNTEMRVSLFGKEDALKQQSPEFVAHVIRQILEEKIKVESGGDIVIRHGKITAIHPCPEP